MAGSEADVRRRMLDAAREELLGRDYDVLAGIVVSRVAERAGVPERTAKRMFKADELRAALKEDLLRVRPGEDIDEDDLIEFAGHLCDRSRRLTDELTGIVDAVFEHNVASELFRSATAFWALGQYDLDVQKRLGSMYEEWIRGGRNGLNAMVAQHQGCIQLRHDWISMDDFVRGVIALLEGLAIQESVRRNSASDADSVSDLSEMDDRLPGRIMLAIFASMIDSPESVGIAEVFQALEERRQII